MPRLDEEEARDAAPVAVSAEEMLSGIAKAAKGVGWDTWADVQAEIERRFERRRLRSRWRRPGG